MASHTPKLHAAFDALKQAIGALESAARTNAARQHEKLAEMETLISESAAEADFLKTDNTRLSNQLQELQQEYLDLQEAAATTVERLDTSVRQLDLILEH